MRSEVFVAIFTVATALSVQAIGKVSRSGRYLYNDDGSRFYIKGIAYQEQGAVVASASNTFGEPSSFIDPLADGAACTRDLPFLNSLGVNAIRVYSVNSSLNHDSCMSTFSNGGIYTIIDLSLPVNGSIDRTSPSWSSNLLDLYIGTIDAFSKYDNVLAYNVGNEVTIASDGSDSDVAAYVKAAARDTKAYLASKSSSTLVGYAAIDAPSDVRTPLASYLSCDPSNTGSGSTAIDIYGLNNYEWCGASTFQGSYAGTNADYAGFNVVAYFSEFGCITSPPRLWTEAAALFSSNMSDIWSGGLAFSYFPATSVQGQFGIVNISSDGTTVTVGDDYNQLKTQYGAVSPPNSPSQSDAGSGSYPSCPSTNSTLRASTSLPPTPNEAACNCVETSLSCKFTPATSNYTGVVGALLDTACGLLGQKGGNCDDIGGNGSTGTYGRLSGCDPTIKLSFVMSEYYESQNRNGDACSFAGNGTVNPLAPTSTSAASAAASSCVSNPDATFTPTALATTGSSTSTSTTTGSGKSSGAAAVLGDPKALLGLGVMSVVGLASAVWTLA
jgi:hypothetical protein